MKVALAYAVADLQGIQRASGELTSSGVEVCGYSLWHDRAVLHCVTSEADQSRYVDTLSLATGPRSVAVFGCSATDGPSRCPGLPVIRRSAGDLANMLGRDWTLVAEAHEQHPTPDGRSQSFTWAAFTRNDAITATS